MEALDGQANLLEVVGALRARGRFAYLLHRRQKQADQDGNDGDHHQQLDQGKSVPPFVPAPAHDNLLVNKISTKKNRETARGVTSQTAESPTIADHDSLTA